MRIMTIYRPADQKRVEGGTPPTAKELEEMGKFIQELAASGVLIATDGLKPSSKGARVRLSSGKFTVTDGPFTESKELIAGFAIMQVETMDQAKELAKRFLKVAGDGESEIRLMYDEPAYPRKG